MTDYSDYMPEKKGPYITFLLDLSQCHICKKDMVKKVKNHRESPFPLWHENSFHTQAKRAGLVIKSGITVDNHYICLDCEKAGLADFLCALCQKRKPTNKIQESYGDPPEFMCQDCYETVPAKLWEEKHDELWNKHRYDFD